MKDNCNKCFVELAFKDKNHSLAESWTCRGSKDLKKVLCDALDLVKDPKTGFAVEPDLEKMTTNLQQYADEKFIKSEFKRQKSGYKTYLEILEWLEDDTRIFFKKIDKQTELTVKV